MRLKDTPYPRFCSIKDCGRSHFGKGFCQTHYNRWYRTGDPLVTVKPRNLPVSERFWAQVEKTDGCWEWQGAPGSGGYGRFKVATNMSVAAHRFMWELTYGLIPDDLWVLHQCDNPICVRPEHLFLGTPKDNRDDAVAKGRAAMGERHGNAKLTDEQVIEMRRLREQGSTQQSIADLFGVSQRAVSLIVRRISWRHVQSQLDS